MAKYVQDINKKRWMVVAPKRVARPSESEGKAICPFCPGNEYLTPPEVYRIGNVRVVPNLFPITDTHEVIIHSPDHANDIESLPKDQVVRIVTAYRDRYGAHMADGHVIIFCNHGAYAGASLTHPHSQLVVVPRQINLDALLREPIVNVVDENDHIVTYCPDFSQWPFEMWLAPKIEGMRFGDTTDGQIPFIASALGAALKKIAAVYADSALSHIHNGNPFGYNFYIFHGINWFIRITPRFIHRAGFELGTGLNVNVVDPTEAAETLKNI
jgi:UDPglucose--hexose-1-phosphate uridylyltransferase